MPALDWHKALLLFLWITPHVLLGVLAVVLYRRRLHRIFPCFFAYALCEIAEFVLLFVLYSVFGLAGKPYAYAFSATLILSIALRFGVIDEVSKDLFRDSQLLKASTRRLLQCVAGLLFVMGVLLAVYAPGGSRFQLVAGVLVVNRGAAMVQSGLLLALLFFSRFLGLSWRHSAFGIALGLGIVTTVDLAMFALRAEFPSAVAAEYLNLLVTGTYLICVSIWIRYALAPEAEPASLALVPDDDEVETWNTAFHHLLKD